MNKIFVIGLSKTATKSIHEAFTYLGIRSLHYPPPSKFRARHSDVMNTTIAFSDINVTYEYKKLDEEYPNSKFILTVREIESWLKSCDNAFGGEKEAYMRNRYANNGISTQVHHGIYGDWGFDRERFIKVYNDHYNDVVNYFSDRLEDLLIIDICSGEGWDKLCPFVGRDIPNREFPHRKDREVTK